MLGTFAMRFSGFSLVSGEGNPRDSGVQGENIRDLSKRERFMWGALTPKPIRLCGVGVLKGVLREKGRKMKKLLGVARCKREKGFRVLKPTKKMLTTTGQILSNEAPAQEIQAKSRDQSRGLSGSDWK